jgi:hypothetical protein
MSHYLLMVDSSSSEFKTLMEVMPATIRSALRDAGSITALLHNMRPLLNSINSTNANISSYKFAKCMIRKSWKQDESPSLFDRKVDWLDVCKDEVCFSLIDEAVVIRFPYGFINRVHMNSQGKEIEVSCALPQHQTDFTPNTVFTFAKLYAMAQIVFHSGTTPKMDKKLLNFLSDNDLPPDDGNLSIIFDFGKKTSEVSALRLCERGLCICLNNPVPHVVSCPYA